MTGASGYYTLVAGQLEHHEATAETSKGPSGRFPIPVAILARLAVDTGHEPTVIPRHRASNLTVAKTVEQVVATECREPGA
jgi:hypothetical protein